jgi:hypothetical protein
MLTTSFDSTRHEASVSPSSNCRSKNAQDVKKLVVRGLIGGPEGR